MPNSPDIMPAIERVLSVTRVFWGVREEVTAARTRLPAAGHPHAKSVAAAIPLHHHPHGVAPTVHRLSA